MNECSGLAAPAALYIAFAERKLAISISQVVQVFRQAIEQWGAPEAVVSDHGAVFMALQPCLAQLAIQWTPITKGHPWQNLAESGFAVQRRMLDGVCRRLHRTADGLSAVRPIRAGLPVLGALGA